MFVWEQSPRLHGALLQTTKNEGDCMTSFQGSNEKNKVPFAFRSNNAQCCLPAIASAFPFLWYMRISTRPTTLKMNDKMRFRKPIKGVDYRRGGQNRACEIYVTGPPVSSYSDTLSIATRQAIRQTPKHTQAYLEMLCLLYPSAYSTRSC